MERNLPLTGNKDADLLILSKLDDKDLFSFCASESKNKNVHKLCNDETFWRNRFIQKYNPTSDWSEKQKNWKRNYLKLTYYINKLKEQHPTYSLYSIMDWALYESAKDGNLDIIDFLISKGFNNEYKILKGAIETDNQNLIDFYNQKRAFGKAGYDILLRFAVEANNKRMVDYYFDKAEYHEYAIRGAFEKNNYEMLKYLYDKMGEVSILSDKTLKEHFHESLEKYGSHNKITGFYLEEKKRRLDNKFPLRKNKR